VSERTRFVGMDTSKTTIDVAVAEGASAPESHGRIANDPSAVRKLVRQLGGPNIRLVAAYEAGPTGYFLHRHLVAMGVDCIVVAPSLIPVRPGDRVKTDRRDALKLARLLRSGDLTSVWVPDAEHESLRNLVRARADAKADQLRAKHRLSKFLLRQGVHPPAGVRPWSAKHDLWLRQMSFPHDADQVVFEDYMTVVRAAGDRVLRLEAALRSCAAADKHAHLIAVLQALHGIGFLSAVTIAAEAGDLRRFASAPQFMAYCGLVPSEHSSGGARRQGSITKTGNAHLRHVLGEAAHHSRHAPHPRAHVRRREEGVPADIVDTAWRAQLRLHSRYRHLAGRIGTNKAITAVARELAGFVWALGQRVHAEGAAA
jgi:transposase